MHTALIRVAYLPDITLGRWRIGDTLFHTLEEPWRPDPDGPGGQRRETPHRESCIPDGIYDLLPHNGAVWQQVWRFVNPAIGVYSMPGDIPAGQKWGRSAILAHSGRSVDSILGCVIVGFGWTHGLGRIELTDSARALEHLRALLKVGTRHSVSIRPSRGTQEDFT